MWCFRSSLHETREKGIPRTGLQEFEVLHSFAVAHYTWTYVYTLYVTDGKNILVLQIEVHSSPYSTTIEKVIIGLVEQFHLYQMSSDWKIKNCVGFAFLIWVIPYQFSKSSHMTSSELDKTWCTISPSGSIIPVGV